MNLDLEIKFILVFFRVYVIMRGVECVDLFVMVICKRFIYGLTFLMGFILVIIVYYFER